MKSFNTYHRPDGVVGCGFYGEFGGLWQHSIAWPDQSAARMRTEDLEDRKIEMKSVAVVPVGERSMIDWASKPADKYSTEKLPYLGDDPDFKKWFTEAVTRLTTDAAPFDKSASEAENIRRAIAYDPDATNKDIIALLNSHGVDVSSAQVTRERRAMKAASEAEAAEPTETAD